MLILTSALFAVAVGWVVLLELVPADGPAAPRGAEAIPIGVLGGLAVLFSVGHNGEVLDRLIYTRELQLVADLGLVDGLAHAWRAGREPAFTVFLWAVGSVGTTTGALYACVAASSIAVYLAAAARLLGSRRLPLLWLSTLALGFFTAYSSIVARQGLSMVLVFAALCLTFSGSRRLWPLVLLATSCLLHWSALPIAVITALIGFVRVPLRAAVVVWVLGAGLFVMQVRLSFLNSVEAVAPRISAYSEAGLLAVYTGGVSRLDFLAFSAVFLIIGLLQSKYADVPPWYSQLLVAYCLFNMYLLLLGFIAYSDRLAAYSWYLAPLIIAAPAGSVGPVGRRARTVSVVAALVAVGFALGPFRHFLHLAGA